MASPIQATTRSAGAPPAGSPPAGVLVHRPARAHPPAPPVGHLTVAAPPTVAVATSSAASWLQYLVPLVGSGGSIAFLFAVPGRRTAWVVTLVVAAAAASVVAGVALRLAERRAARRANRRERARYLSHLGQTAVRADRLAAAQLAAAEHLHPDPPGLWATVNRTDRLWERRPADADFLTVRAGRGRVPLTAPVRLDGTADPLAEHDPELLLAAEELVRRATWLPDAPVPISLTRAGLLALTGPPDRIRALARAIVCELAAFHAPEDLRILAAYPPAARLAWRWMERLPHSRDPTLTTGEPPGCLLADTQPELDTQLTRELRRRLATPRNRGSPSDIATGPGPGTGPGGSGSAGARPHLVVLVDTTETGWGGHPPGRDVPATPARPATPGGPGPTPPLATPPLGTPPPASPPPATAAAGWTLRGAVLDELLQRPAAAGMTVIWLARNISGEPSELSMRVRVDDRGSATVQETAQGGRLLTGIRADTAELALCEAIAGYLAPRRLDRGTAAARAGPVRLVDLLGPGAGPAGGAALRPRARAEFLRVPVGTTADGQPLVLDLKEAAEGGIGPHGLVIGATGTGKSELLRTIVAGLATTHPPDQLAFVLVDFKGGAAFADLAPLPQVAGLITNLQADLSMVDRAMAALQGELARRQRLLHQAGNQPDLRAYAARRGSDPWLEPLPHLLLVVDEFGELLAARPEFLELFAAIGRVGRSLGMHLLLASQRLEEGRLRGLDSHLRFRICLRTFSAAESTAVLGVSDAYHLPPAPGTALLKVDAAPPVPFTAALVSPGRRGDGAGHPPDLAVLGGGLAGEARPVHQVWLPPLATEVDLDRLLQAWAPAWLQVPVGVVDRPLEQDQGPLVLDLSKGAGHLAVVGAPRTGKSTLLGAVVAGLAATHPPDEVQVYAVDFGGGLLHRLRDLPHVGAVCGPREAERAHRLVRELRSLLLERARRFRDLGVESMASWHALRRTGLDLGGYGEVFLVVDNWAALVRELPELEAEITELAAVGLHYGVHLVLAANRWAELRPGLRENLGGRLELRLNDPLESELGRAAAAALPDVPGRGLTQSGLQFQAALPGDARAVLDRAQTGRDGAAAPPLRLLPTLLTETALPAAGPGGCAAGPAGSPAGPARCAVGPGGSVAWPGTSTAGPGGNGSGPRASAGLPFAVEEHGLAVVRLDLFGEAPHLVVLGDAGCGKSSLLRLVARGLAARHPPDEVALLVVDLRRRLLDLTALPNLVGYACATTAVTQAVDHLRRELEARLAAALDILPDPAATGLGGLAGTAGLDGGPRAGRFGGPARTGPRYVVLVDDYDLLPATAGSPLLPLLDLLGLGSEVGLHLVLARRVAGVARAAFEPVFQRLRELGGPGLIMRGDPGEGPLLAGQAAAALPPGRGFLVDPPRAPTLVQVAYSPPPAPGHTDASGRHGPEVVGEG